ncbi:Large subunit GTPase 1-like protein [Cryptotermes secundus]|uniref:Large subunit GTPase 1 homolog n=1 Tax=Cryptotermes secundus TaxID=105785 RepID=A0A2J7PJE9_9NEOP|nr:large subunit GTPase 1 homolog [Cryptotermes secundus]PNF16467.1 Large subunit GTPase 1-like protein [Cryptotermes secundus]
MGKKNKSTANLGRSLIKDRFGSAGRTRRNKDPSLLHTADVDDGYEWGRLNLQSVTEESSFQAFLSTAELAGTEFQAEKLNITFVNPMSGVGLLSGEDKEKVKGAQDKNKQLLGIPRRPKWDINTTAEQLQAAERDEFLEWRRRLAKLQEVEGILLTPYEKNLEFWRQLWRVVERSDVVVQIVDARNPLLFRCEDLETYVKEVSPDKLNLILINKADFLTQSQRRAWAEYFSGLNVKAAFFSATLAAETGKSEGDDETDDGVSPHQDVAEYPESEEEGKLEEQSQFTDTDVTESCTEMSADSETVAVTSTGEFTNSDILLTREELVTVFKSFHKGPKVTAGVTTIGMVGYPNVGKSSTINALLTYKKVSVSSTPGKTKHFQTLFLEPNLMLCDCPGLVMPSFMFTKAEMVVNGILPIDQMRDHVPPVTLIASLIPRHVLEHTYGIMLPPPAEGEDPTRPPTAEELLNAYGYNRGFMTQNGQPDNPRAARYILKDFVKGKLLYCHAPSTNDQSQYHTFPERQKQSKAAILPPLAVRLLKSNKLSTEDLDRQFFQKMSVGVHKKGTQSSSDNSDASENTKPWKDHRNKRNKREKLRRVYAYLDQ